MVDASDAERLEESAEALNTLLHRDPLQNAAFLIFANKQDLPNALGAAELTERLKLNQEIAQPWKVQPCIASTGIGLYEGLLWLASELKKQ